jgi:hypothetical protein
MSAGRFRVTRIDGRSNTDVIVDYIKNGEPGRIYGYDELIGALNVGATHSYTLRHLQQIVASGYDRIVKRTERVLQAIPTIGYRLAHANEHGRLAVRRTQKADVQMRHAVLTLENVRWSEMEEQTRKAHEATLMILSGVYQQQKAMDKRLRAVEQSIQEIRASKAG